MASNADLDSDIISHIDGQVDRRESIRAPRRPSRKRLIKVAGLIGVLAAISVASTGLTRWYADIESSADRFDILNIAADIPPGLVDAVTWRADSPGLARPVEPMTRDELSATWVRAWQQIEIASSTGDTTGLEIYFSNSALAALTQAGDSALASGKQIAHDLTIHFYSADGQQVGITANKVELLRSIPVAEGNAWFHAEESYDVVLVLEDGNWRINHWVRRTSDQVWITEPIDPADNAQLVSGVGINYYPRDHPFEEFWPNYDPDVAASDLDLIKSLGLVSIRIFVPYFEIGGADVTAEDLAPIMDFLDKAEERSLTVTVTLFDNRTDHRPQNWLHDRRYLTTVITTLADHKAVAVWDLKNEPDRDIGIHGVDADGIHGWLSYVGRIVRELDPNTPLTIGWSTPESALTAPPITDIISFHYYGPTKELSSVIDQLTAHAEGRPVVLSEVGLPSWNTVWPGGHTEEEQMVYVAEVLSHANQSDLAALKVWTLWDFSTGPTDVGSAPWQEGPQTNMGLVRNDETLKPVAKLFGGSTETDLPTVSRLDKVFWRLAVLGIGTTIGPLMLRRLASRRRIMWMWQ